MNTETHTGPWWAKVHTAIIRRNDLPRAARLLYCILVGKADAATGAVPATVTARWLMSVLGVGDKPAGRANVDAWIKALVESRLLAVTVPTPGAGRVFTVRYPEWVFTATAALAAEDDALETAPAENPADDDARITLATAADHFAKLSMAVLTDTSLTREHRLLYTLVATYVQWSPQHVRSTYAKARTLARSMGYDVDAADGGRSSVSKGLKALEDTGHVRSHPQVRADGTGTMGPNVLVLLDAESVGLDPAVVQGDPDPMPGYRFANVAARAVRTETREWAAQVAMSEPPAEIATEPAPAAAAADRPASPDAIRGIRERFSLKALADTLSADPDARPRAVRRRSA